MRSAHGAPALAPPRLSLSMQCFHEAHWHWQTAGGWAGGSELSHARSAEVHTSSTTGLISITACAGSATAAMVAELGLEAGSTAAPGAALALALWSSKQTAPARQGQRVIEAPSGPSLAAVTGDWAPGCRRRGGTGSNAMLLQAD